LNKREEKKKEGKRKQGKEGKGRVGKANDFSFVEAFTLQHVIC
jgi:hypothetical protein